ncbi:hypothetical protein Ndes2437A_g06570 [Nannochloris sp. 'desiccata']
MRLRDRLSIFLGFSRQCLPFIQGGDYRGDLNGVYSRLPRNESLNTFCSNPSSNLLRSCSSGDEYQTNNSSSSSTSSTKRKLSSRRLFNGITRAARPSSRREQLLLVVVFICILQMAWMRQAQSKSLLVWVRDSLDRPEPGQPPVRTAYLPATEVLPSSLDPCAQALGIKKVALMFLTTGDLYHEQTWRLWFKSAVNVIPAQSMATSLCHAEGASAKLMEATAACRPGPNANQTNNIIAQQHIFSVYIHAPPSFRGYDFESLWAGKLVRHRVKTSWGAHTLVEATRHLLWEAFRDPLNTRFLLLSESDIPLYDPLTLWQQLQSETKSRLDTCKHQETSPWRWDPRMETANLRFHHWRKSPQWMTMTRDHVELVLADKEVYRKFERHCWSSWDDKHGRWHRDCFSDEHYFATLLAAEGRDDEGVCAARGVSYTEWEGNSAHPKEFGPQVIDVELFRRARAAPLSATHQPTTACDWMAAQQAALALFVSKDQALGAQSVDLCGRMWRHPPTFKARLPETCFLTARKFPYQSRNRVRTVFLQCGNGIELLRQEVCMAEGGQRCDSVWGKVKGLFSRDPC